MPIYFDISDYPNPVFFETGTYKGKATAQALKAGFDTVHTVDVQRQFVNRARQRFSQDVESGRCHVHLGHSVDVMREVLPSIDRPITFWLDAHADGSGNIGVGEPDEDERKCPVYEELELIAELRDGQDTVLVDDLRLIRKGGWGRDDLNEDRLMELVRAINPDYRVSYRDGWTDGDVLVAQP